MSGNDHIIKRLILFNRSFLARAFQLKKESADGEIFFWMLHYERQCRKTKYEKSAFLYDERIR